MGGQQFAMGMVHPIQVISFRHGVFPACAEGVVI
jgi:hypothetical protein